MPIKIDEVKPLGIDRVKKLVLSNRGKQLFSESEINEKCGIPRGSFRHMIERLGFDRVKNKGDLYRATWYYGVKEDIEKAKKLQEG